ncbi:hypothetical protein ILUMI_17583 [Ignelater luminosus]|uniref:Uncharacterized protein n=1 Tax=Ignelater luminosus TaxID=2038154 RepID=A0A8K0CJV3_IGNLU|nr:hypothetical protein ILUMI_17583 [Ignelater luminosus]
MPKQKNQRISNRSAWSDDSMRRAVKVIEDGDASLEEITEVFDNDATDDEYKSVELRNTSCEELCPLPAPKIQRVSFKRKQRSVKRKQKSVILTSSPLKMELEEKEEESFTGYKKCILR